MGIAQGLRCASEVGIRKAVLQTESKTAIQLLESATSTHPHFMVVSEIRHILQRDWQVRIEHVFRDGNAMANFLASTDHSAPPGIHIINQPSIMLRYWLIFDRTGIETPRFVIG
ncbi:unnamed protein product [Linum trigynum]|uniref:RNase H type-1 domain-containing protein n=1 Tax=Linum trigynum TaxID=586398 RepID=A0AAV2F040_9ROSI